MQALRKDPKERPSAEELLMHPWLAFHAAKRPHEAPAKLSDAAKAGGSNAWLQRRPGSAVATFASPNASLSPRLGSWKINTLPGKHPYSHSQCNVKQGEMCPCCLL